MIHILFGVERYIFINEIMTLVGALILLNFIFINAAIHRVHICVVFLFFYCVLSVIIGSLENNGATFYQMLRTYPFMYSILCYFVGFYFLYSSFTYSKSNKGIFLLGGLALGNKLATPVGIAMFLNKKYSNSFFLKVLILLLIMLEVVHLGFGDYHGSSTLLLMILYVVALIIFRSKIVSVVASKAFVYLVILILIVFFCALHYVYYNFYEFYDVGFSVFGEGGDTNLLWRLMFWAKLVGDMSIGELFWGIKLSTPIFDPLDPTNLFIVNSDPTAENRPYTLGPHNSFVFMFVRLGGAFLLGFILYMGGILRKLALSPDKLSFRLFVCLSLAIISMSFNVFMETPLYSGIFWEVVGMSQKHLSAQGRV